MSKENTSYDVRLALYDGTRNPLALVQFFNDCELLLERKRVILVRDGNRLYFHKVDTVKGSIKLSCGGDKLQLWKDYSKVRDMEGNYDLKYDEDVDLYYIDKSEKISDHEHKSVLKGIKHVNYKTGTREHVELKGEQIVTAILKDRGKKAVEKVYNQNKENTNAVVLMALFALLKDQVKDNADALSTIEVMEKFM